MYKSEISFHMFYEFIIYYTSLVSINFDGFKKDIIEYL